jgi:hypothetical protein
MPSPPATSGLRRQPPTRSRAWTDAPTLVADALVAVREPLVTALRPGTPAAASAVASALAQSLAPPEAGDTAPRWLWPEQVPSFRRALAAVRSYGGALLADPVGTGKTYVALAVAAAVNRRDPTACFVPAVLLEQWREVARRVAVPALVWSHERVSRGALPEGCGRLALVDESHHFRNPVTKRYLHLAPWLVRRRALLLSASPIVNRLPDLQHQLALTVRDDALARHGLPSLARLLQEGRGHPALGHVVVLRPSATARRPVARERVVPLDDTALAPLGGVLTGVDRLRLSTSRPIAALVRGVFWRAAASSPAALLASLERYRRLLLHARDAARAGQVLDRRTLQTLTDGLGDQLLLWELIGVAPTGSELAIDDLLALDELRKAAALAACQPDPKLESLSALLADGRCTLVFASAKETVRYLRDRLTSGPVAWCTGERAGIGRQTVARHAVLDWFGPRVPATGNGSLDGLGPRILVATDVAAEGLDLQRAARVIHYDLPWTPARLEQREGRARRAGAAHAEMEVVRFEPPPAVEARLRQLACLAGKRRLPATMGLDESSRALWRWRVDLAERFRDCPARHGVARVCATPAGALAGFAFHAWPDAPSDGPLASWVVWWDAAGGWSDDDELIAERLETAARDTAPAPDPGALGALVDSTLTRLAPLIRERMRELRLSRWLDLPPLATARALVPRLQALAQAAARRRDAPRLDRLQSALRFAAGGHTAGERALLTHVARVSDPELERAVAELPLASPTWEAVHCRLTGLIVFAP